MNIKDFILNNIDEIEEKQAKKPKKQSEMIFNIEYENDTDFIISRKTPKTEKILVFLISQGQFYIKDCKTNEIERINDVGQMNTFKPRTYYIDFKKLSYTPFNYLKSFDKDLFNDILYRPDTYKTLANRKLNPFENRHLVLQYERDPSCFNNREKVLKMMRVLNPNENIGYNWDKLVEHVLKLRLDINFIEKNKELILELGYDTFKDLLFDNYFLGIILDYKCDMVSLLKYFLYTIRNRNHLSISNYYGYGFRPSDYVDYLRMQIEMYGKIKEKYPVYWLSEKQILVGKYNLWKKLKQDDLIELNQENMTKYEFEDRYYKIIIPKNSAEILDEAEQQEHCLASYVDKIRDGKTNVVFIRNQLNLEQSCLTVEIYNDKIHQIKGHYNRKPTEDEMKFVNKWCKEKELDIASM